MLWENQISSNNRHSLYSQLYSQRLSGPKAELIGVKCKLKFLPGIYWLNLNYEEISTQRMAFVEPVSTNNNICEMMLNGFTISYHE